MANYEKASLEMSFGDPSDGDSLSMTIEGMSAMPFWLHDLKFMAAISLLESVDYKDFFESGLEVEYEKFVKQLEDLVKSLKPF